MMCESQEILAEMTLLHMIMPWETMTATAPRTALLILLQLQRPPVEHSCIFLPVARHISRNFIVVFEDVMNLLLLFPIGPGSGLLCILWSDEFPSV